MSEMTYELNQMHERAAVTECLSAVTVTNENGRHAPTVIIVPDSSNLLVRSKKKCASIFGLSLKS